jgi:Glycosyltransferase 61
MLFLSNVVDTINQTSYRSLPEDRDYHLTINHGPGSIEHFYHFLLGFFVPLIHQISITWRDRRLGRIFVRSCGPMDRILREIGDGRLEIIDKQLHSRMRKPTAPDSSLRCKPLDLMPPAIQFVTLQGCDYPSTFDARKFARVRETWGSFENVRKEIETVGRDWIQSDARILLIERGSGDPFYWSERSEAKGSGRERRSVNNHRELYHALLQKHNGCLNVVLEEIPLARQFALFSLADIIIAQHGAALANLIWARAGATIIEIFPKTLRLDQKIWDLFRYLALCVGLRHRRFFQSEEHGEVAVELLCALVAKLIASPDRSIVSRLRKVIFVGIRPLFVLKFALLFFSCRALNRFAKGAAVIDD